METVADTIKPVMLWLMKNLFFKWARKKYPETMFQQNVTIEIKNETNVNISLSNPPDISFWIEIRNNTGFTIDMDRILMKFFYGNELARPMHFERLKIKPNTSESVYVRAPIDFLSIKALAFNHAHNNSSEHVRLEYYAACKCELHEFAIKGSRKNIKPEITNEHLLSQPPYSAK